MSSYNRYGGRSGYNSGYRRDMGSTVAMWFGMGLITATLIADVSHSHDQQPTKDQLKSEIAGELGHEYAPVTGLTVNTDAQSFDFQTVDAGQAERCTGDYAVRQAKAVLAGKLTCTPVVVTNQ